MPKYIDAYKLLKHWTFSKSGEKFPLHDCDNFPVTVPIKDVQHSIIDSEPEDVEPVTHAHWERTDLCDNDPLRCTNCYNTVPVMGFLRCLYCGAHMDEQEEAQ